MAAWPAMAQASATDAEIERIIDAMTPRERVTQLLLVGFTGTRTNDEIRRLVADWKVGALAVYSRNISGPEDLRALTTDIRALAKGGLMPLIAVDQEGGEVARVAQGVAQLPGQMALGATRSAELAERAGRVLGQGLRGLGVTLNLAPVLDVGAPSSPIGIRAFGHDPQLAAHLGAAFIRGQSAAGIASAAKHFPGIGVAAADSHHELPVLQGTLDELRRVNFPPFAAAIEAGAAAVMVGHVAVPSIDGMTPATLSPRIIGLLRDELHFKGIVITDALEMRALDRRGGIGALALQSINAGADLVMVLWQARDREEVLEVLAAAYGSKALPERRVRESLRRILRLKMNRPPDVTLGHDLKIAEEIALSALTVLRNDSALLPLRGTARRAYIGPAGPIADAARAASFVHLPSNIRKESIEEWSSRARAAAANADVIIGAAQNLAQLAAIRAAHEAQPSARLILISLGSPQLISGLGDASAYICAYGYLPPSQRAVAALVRGHVGARGTLPVDVPGFFKAGAGMAIERSATP